MSDKGTRTGLKKRFPWWCWFIVLLFLGLYVGPRLWTTVRFADRAHVPGVNGDFRLLDSLVPPSGSEIVSLHRGLPHNFAYPVDFLTAVWLTPTWSYHGYRFQFAEWKPSPSFRSIAQEVLSQRSSFVPYRGPKLCGGYHADFLAEFRTPDGPIQFMICFGCQEVLVFGPHQSCIVELTDEACEHLVTAWGDEPH